MIAEVSDGHPMIRDWTKIQGGAVHRVGLDDQTGVVLGYDAVSISAHFTGEDTTYPLVARATGGQLAYSIMIGGDRGPPDLDGVVWQTLPLDDYGHHARRFSKPWIGIGCIGDFRKDVGRPMSPSQRASLVDILALITPALGWDPYRDIKGHGEIKGAHGGEKTPGKPAACPGDWVAMNTIRDDVATLARDGARRRLHEAGVIFTS